MIENNGQLLDPPGAADFLAKPRDILTAVFRHWFKLLVSIMLVFAIALLWTFATPKRFSSEMVLLVQNARGTDFITSGNSGGAPAVNDVSEEQLNSEVAVLNSSDLLSEVVDPGWEQRQQNSPTREQALHHQKQLQSLRSRLDVSATRTSHIIKVKFDAASPEVARDSLTLLLQTFLRKQKELGRLPGASQVFSQQAAQYQKELESARHDLANYQNQHGFVSPNTEEASLEGKLSDLQAAARETDAQMNELGNRIATDNQQITGLPERLPTLQKTLPSTQTIDQLNVMLMTLRNKRTELLTKFNADDRLVREVDQQIADTTSGLRQATTSAPTEISTDVNPLWAASRRDLYLNEVALSGLRAKRASLRTQITTLLSSLGATEQQSGEYGSLEQRVQELEARYRTFAQKRDESLMSDLMDQQQWLNVAVVEYPTLTLLPVHPRPLMDLILGFLTALLVGGCTVILLEMMRQQVSTPAELEASSRYAVLATIPFTPPVLGDGEPLRHPSNVISPSDQSAQDEHLPQAAATPLVGSQT